LFNSEPEHVLVSIVLVVLLSGLFKKGLNLRSEHTFSRQFLANNTGRGKICIEKKTTIMEYLAFLSVKRSICLSELYQAMVAAREKGKNTSKFTY